MVTEITNFIFRDLLLSNTDPPIVLKLTEIFLFHEILFKKSPYYSLHVTLYVQGFDDIFFLNIKFIFVSYYFVGSIDKLVLYLDKFIKSVLYENDEFTPNN